MLKSLSLHNKVLSYVFSLYMKFSSVCSVCRHYAHPMSVCVCVCVQIHRADRQPQPPSVHSPQGFHQLPGLPPHHLLRGQQPQLPCAGHTLADAGARGSGLAGKKPKSQRRPVWVVMLGLQPVLCFCPFGSNCCFGRASLARGGGASLHTLVIIWGRVVSAEGQWVFWSLVMDFSDMCERKRPFCFSFHPFFTPLLLIWYDMTW